MTPSPIWCFVTKHHKITGTTEDKDEANQWVGWLKKGDVVVEYKAVKVQEYRKVAK